MRIEAVGARKERAGRGQIGDVGIHLAREHWIGRQPRFLRPFDLAVPISALDEAHGDTPAGRPSHRRKPFDQRQRALAIGLHSKPEPVPAGKFEIGEKRLHQRERKIEPLGLFGIDGERQPGVPHGVREGREPRQKLGVEARFLRRLITGVERRELDREPGTAQQLVFAPRRGTGPGSDLFCRRVVAQGITLRVVACARRLPQHVEREAIALPGFVLGVGERPPRWSLRARTDCPGCALPSAAPGE